MKEMTKEFKEMVTRISNHCKEYKMEGWCSDCPIDTICDEIYDHAREYNNDRDYIELKDPNRWDKREIEKLWLIVNNESVYYHDMIKTISEFCREQDNCEKCMDNNINGCCRDCRNILEPLRLKCDYKIGVINWYNNDILYEELKKSKYQRYIEAMHSRIVKVKCEEERENEQ